MITNHFASEESEITWIECVKHVIFPLTRFNSSFWSVDNVRIANYLNNERFTGFRGQFFMTEIDISPNIQFLSISDLDKLNDHTILINFEQ